MGKNIKSKDLIKLLDETNILNMLDENARVLLSSFLEKVDKSFLEMSYDQTFLRDKIERLQIIAELAPCTISWVTDKLEYQGVNRTLSQECPEYKGKKIGFQSKDSKFYEFAKELFKIHEVCLSQEILSVIDGENRYFKVVGKKFNNFEEGVIIGSETTLLKNTEKKLRDTEKLIEIDDLTGLYNMRSVYQKIEGELARGERFGHSVGVIMLDMDHFKDVNDDHNHLFGSHVLSEVGKILKRSMRNIDLGARFGGDEFLVVVTRTNLDGIKIFCERIRSEVENYHFKMGKDETKRTVSVGFSITRPGSNSVTAKGLVRAADEAMYRAKSAGRNCVRGNNEMENPVLFQDGPLLEKHG